MTWEIDKLTNDCPERLIVLAYVHNELIYMIICTYSYNMSMKYCVAVGKVQCRYLSSGMNCVYYGLKFCLFVEVDGLWIKKDIEKYLEQTYILFY